MKITKENYKQVIPEKEQSIIDALLEDLTEINQYNDLNLYIDWQDYHNEYSCERTDPCPDFYGYYTLRFEGLDSGTVGESMTLEELDHALFFLYEYEDLKRLVP